MVIIVTLDFFPGRMHTQVHDKHWMTQTWLCHCLQLRFRPAGQWLYLDFFSVSWHHGLQFALAPALQFSPPSQSISPPTCSVRDGIVACSHCGPTSHCLGFLLFRTVNRLRNVIPGHHLQRNHIDICSPHVQIQVMLEAVFAHCHVRRG